MNTVRLGTESGGWSIDLDSIRDGDLILDAGVGGDVSFSQELSKLRKTKTVFIDPSPISAEITNQLKEFETAVIEAAVSVNTGILPLYLSNSGGSDSLCSEHQGMGRSYRSVPCLSLHSLVSSLRPALVKLDIEGEEYAVYRQCLGVKQVAIEFHHRMMRRKTVEDTEAAIIFFIKNGYQIIHRTGLDEITFLLSDIPPFSLSLVKHSVEDLLDDIRCGILYSFARYGDGEFWSILGRSGNNANEHSWLPELKADLVRALTSSPEYRVAIVQRFMENPRFGNYPKTFLWLRENNVNLNWYDQEVFADSLITATEEGKVAPLVGFLQSKPRPAGVGSVLLVGPGYLEGLSKVFSFNSHVKTPDFNCYLEKSSIEHRIREAFAVLPKPVLCLISASMVAEVIIDDLYESLKSLGWLIDVGSIWNPYLGRSNRTYWDRMKVPVY